MDLLFLGQFLGHQIQIPESAAAKVKPSLLQQKVDGDVLLKALGAVVDAASIPYKERESLMSFVPRALMEKGPWLKRFFTTLTSTRNWENHRN